MIPELRREFNEHWRPELYSEFLRRLDRVSGAHVDYRCSETPVFLPGGLMNKMERYGKELYAQLQRSPEYRRAAEATIPNEYRFAGETEHPLFLQVDFGLVREPDGSLEPKLVEIQGFPSIYGFQAELIKTYETVYRLESYDPRLTAFLSGLNECAYWDLLRRAILNGHAPEEVILLEIDPYHQKTLPDFLVTEQKVGVRPVCITQVEQRGRRLFFNDREIKRIYNRVIVDELIRRNIKPGFELTADLDVEWAGHPNWFFLISKFSLPWLHHICVPPTWFLSELDELPEPLEDYVLKPLYSFAGLGVKIGPSREEIDAIPRDRRGDFVLQRRLDFVPTLDTPAGPTKLEIRVMYVWDGELTPVTTVVRTGRGKMMGVDFNKNLDWVGASAGFIVGPSPH